MENVYVTVGTTKFDSLIKAVTSAESLKALRKRGCRRLVLQLGKGSAVDEQFIKEQYGIEVEQYEFRLNPERKELLQANLVIGHAGAGTCLDVLEHKKAALIVVNEELMNNHQTELAQQLSEDGYVHMCRVIDVAESLSTLDFSGLKPYEDHSKNLENFANYVTDFVRETLE